MEVTAVEKRVERRLKPQGLACNLGVVVDISLTGICILSRRQLRGKNTVVFDLPGKRRLRLHARRVWHRHHGAGQHVHGLHFHQVTAEQREQLTELTRLICSGGLRTSRPASSGHGLFSWGLLLIAALLTGGWLAASQRPELVQAYVPQAYEVMQQYPVIQPLLPAVAGGAAILWLVWCLVKLRRAKGLQAAAPHAAAPMVSAEQFQAMQHSQYTLNCILESSLGGVSVLETQRSSTGKFTGFQVQLINPAGETIVGKPASILVGKTLESTLPCLTQHDLYRELIASVETGLPHQKEYQIGPGDRWYHVAVVKLADGLAITFLDTTQAQVQQQRLHHIAYHDELTGLPNRKALIEHLDHAISRTAGSPGHCSALLFLDFDRFKHVNDTLGHDAGDALLIGIAQRLRENLRDTDQVRVGGLEQIPARFGGDEFIVLLDGLNSEDDAVQIAKRLLRCFSEPHDLAGQLVTSTASIGIAINRGEYKTPDDLLRNADAAMYAAKQSGKARYVLFDHNLHESLNNQYEKEQTLRQAVDDEAFVLRYEPIVELDSGRIVGFEALIRWEHPEDGLVLPVQFVPLAEEINLIGRIGEWVIKQACAQLADWRRQGIDDIFLNVNLSRGQLYEPELLLLLEEQLRTHELKPSQLHLELTETMVMNDLAFMAERMAEIKKLGVGLALDDFGTGYSSLNVLHQLPFDTLKIDRVFLNNMRQGVYRGSAVIGTITDLAHHFNLEVIVEGISGVEEVAFFQTLACRYGQGWHFSKAVEGDDAAAMALAGPILVKQNAG